MKDSFKSIERLCRSGKTQVGSKAEGIIVLGGLRKKYWLNTLSDFALKRLFIRSLTKSVLQYSEGLVQINWAPM